MRSSHIIRLVVVFFAFGTLTACGEGAKQDSPEDGQILTNKLPGTVLPTPAAALTVTAPSTEDTAPSQASPSAAASLPPLSRAVLPDLLHPCRVNPVVCMATPTAPSTKPSGPDDPLGSQAIRRIPIEDILNKITLKSPATLVEATSSPVSLVVGSQILFTNDGTASASVIHPTGKKETFSNFTLHMNGANTYVNDIGKIVVLPPSDLSAQLESLLISPAVKDMVPRNYLPSEVR